MPPKPVYLEQYLRSTNPVYDESVGSASRNVLCYAFLFGWASAKTLQRYTEGCLSTEFIWFVNQVYGGKSGLSYLNFNCTKSVLPVGLPLWQYGTIFDFKGCSAQTKGKRTATTDFIPVLECESHIISLSETFWTIPPAHWSYTMSLTLTTASYHSAVG